MILVMTWTGINLVYAEGHKVVRTYPITGHGILELKVPPTWKGDYQPQKDMPSTIIFIPGKGNDFKILITVLGAKTGEKDFNSQDKIKALVERDGQRILSKAMETKLIVHQMRGVHNFGYFFTLTDKAPHPGDFRYLTRGRMSVGNLLLNVTLLHRVKDSESIKEALSMLREAEQSIK